MNEIHSQRRIAKPIGLYIITVCDFIAVGLLPLLVFIIVVRRNDVEVAFVDILISVGLTIFAMGAAVWAWTGDYVARYVLLTLVSAICLLGIQNGVNQFLNADVDSSTRLREVGVVVRAMFWLSINWWYFNRKHVVAYFRQNQ